MQLKIWHKMIIGISIPSFIAILGGVLTYGYISDVKNRQGFVQIADDLKEHVLEVRRNEKNFLHYKNAEYFGNLHDAISVLTNSINNISPETMEGIGKEEFFLLNKSIQTYSGLIENLYENYQQEIKVTEKVRAEGRKLETFVAKGKHAKELSISFILNLRRLEKNYMLFHDKESFLKLDSGLSQVQNIIPFCYECAPYIEAINNLSTAYEESDLIVNDLQVTGDKLEEFTGIITNYERQKIGSFLTLTQRFLLVALALLCTLGPLFVYKTASYIVAPIKRLAEITRKISEGDITLRAPLKEHDETYSLAISFNTMLDHLYQTQESLEKSLYLLHEKQSQLVEAEKHASIGLLVSGVAHEIKNPLAGISCAIQVLQSELSEDDSKKAVTTEILNQVKRLDRIVKDLLSYAKPKPPQFLPFKINDVIQKAFFFVYPEAKKQNVVIDIEIERDIPDIMMDPNQMQQAFLNLMINAVQAMPTGGKLTVSVSQKDYQQIEDKIKRPLNSDKILVIRFQDTGKGITYEDMEYIFEPFFTRKSKGTGLGLSISQRIVQEHGGKLTCNSKVDKGSVFTIYLPVVNS